MTEDEKFWIEMKVRLMAGFAANSEVGNYGANVVFDLATKAVKLVKDEYAKPQPQQPLRQAYNQVHHTPDSF